MVFSIVYPWKNILAFFCVSKTKCLALYSYHPRARNAFYHYKKKGRIKGCLWVCLQGHPFCLAGRGDACGVKLLYDSLLWVKRTSLQSWRCLSSRSPLSIFLLRYHKDIQQEKAERGSLLEACDEAFGAPFSSVTRSENGYQTAAIVDGVLVFVFLPLSSRKDNSF